jgi:hypothetical protein
MNEEHTPEAPLDPAAMLALVEEQQSAVGRKIASQIPWILFAWAVAWGAGFMALWLIDGAEPAFSIPWQLGAVIYAGLLVAAVVVSAIIGSRAGRGIRNSPSAAFTGTVYGITCSVGFIAMYVFGVALVRNGMPLELQFIYYPVASTLLVGIMYLVAGAIWHGVPMIVLGGWVILVALVSPFFGYPTHYLIFAIGGGGGFLVAWLIMLSWVRSGRAMVPA